MRNFWNSSHAPSESTVYVSRSIFYVLCFEVFEFNARMLSTYYDSVYSAANAARYWINAKKNVVEPEARNRGSLPFVTGSSGIPSNEGVLCNSSQVVMAQAFPFFSSVTGFLYISPPFSAFFFLRFVFFAYFFRFSSCGFCVPWGEKKRKKKEKKLVVARIRETRRNEAPRV